MTALTMSKNELRNRAKRLVIRHRRVAEHHSFGTAEREVLFAAVQRWAAVVHTRYPNVRVFVLCSLLNPERWRGSASDVDLAVDGVHGADYWQIWKLAEEVLPGVNIDLIDLEMATSVFREAVERSGVQL